jgi:NADH dehydrogenase
MLAKTTRAELDRSSRVVVGPDLTLPGHPEIFVAGDLAHCADPRTGGPLPGVAPVALQQGAHVARAIRLRLAQRPVRPFRYRDKGQLATIGRAAAVADLGRLQFSGYPAWLLWLFIHLMYLVEFENRLLVFVQWAWNYLTWDRGARIIGETERR